MTTIKAIVRDGRIEVSSSLSLPDGTVLQIPVPTNTGASDELDSTDEIERDLANMDRMEPLQMTDDELAAWEADRRARRDLEKATFVEQARNLQRMWE